MRRTAGHAGVYPPGRLLSVGSASRPRRLGPRLAVVAAGAALLSVFGADASRGVPSEEEAVSSFPGAA
jgi:hypothetical protein